MLKAYFKEVVLIFLKLSTGIVIEPSIKCIVVCTCLDFIMYLSNSVICIYHFLCIRTVRLILCPSSDFFFSHFKVFCCDVLVILYMLAGSGLELITSVTAPLKGITVSSKISHEGRDYLNERLNQISMRKKTG